MEPDHADSCTDHGDPAGIGGELTLRTWLALRHTQRRFVALDDPDRLATLAATMGLDVPIRAVTDPADAVAIFRRRTSGHPRAAGKPRAYPGDRTRRTPAR